jgi:glycosyltransferase involved in cell wall biosynthesis
MTIRMADLLKRMGHYVILYGHEENTAPCDEHVVCITKAEADGIIGSFPYQNAVMTAQNPLWVIFNPRAAEEIGKRKQPHDCIFTLGGNAQRLITDAHPDLMDVEYSIGYEGNYARYRVWESAAWQHHCYGAQSIKTVRFYDAVIPGFLDEAKMTPNYSPEPYVAYVGRIVPKKGIKIACEAAKAAGVPLKIVGHGDPSLLTYGEFLGALDNAGRDEVMAKASAVLCPTCYIEPFNYVGIEAQMLGTPVISSNAGGFLETVEHGCSGLRCDLLGEFAKGIKAAVDGMFDRRYIRQRAEANYGIQPAIDAYGAYFAKLETIWDKGWNTL